MGEFWVVNSEPSKKAYIACVEADYAEHKYLTYPKARIGVDRSIGQNSLFHLWLSEFAAFLTPCHYKEVTPGMLSGIKRTMKKLFYQEFHDSWMIHTVICPLTKQEKKDFTSSKSWKQPEMYKVLTWLQMYAAEHCCILESKGEFAKLQREQNK